MSEPNFNQSIALVRNGQLHVELSDALSKLVAAVKDHRKGGSLTLTLKIKPFSKGDSDTLVLEDQIVVKAPMGDKGATVFYATDRNGLSRQDPRQPELSGLRVLEGPRPAAVDGRSAAAND